MQECLMRALSSGPQHGKPFAEGFPGPSGYNQLDNSDRSIDSYGINLNDKSGYQKQHVSDNHSESEED